MDFWRAAHLLGKRKWFIILSLIVTTVLTYGATRLVGQEWQASVRFVIAQPLPIAGAGKSEDINRYNDPQMEMRMGKVDATKYQMTAGSPAVIKEIQNK